MRRLPLADELPYGFFPPRPTPWLLRASRPFRRRMLRRGLRVEAIEHQGVEHLKPLLDRGDAVLIAPNHPDHADPYVMLDLGDRLARPFCFMAAYQVFTGNAGLRRRLLTRLGAFPVDREGSDLKAFKTAVDILAGAKNPLVIFPEGEIYHMADRLTPLREGTSAIALTAAKKLADSGKKVWLVPAAIKYRFLEGHDPLPSLLALMADLEGRYTWWPRTERSLVDRIYHYAEGTLGLMELEYLGGPRSGPLKDRLMWLRTHILDQLEDRHFGRRRDEPVPVRVKELRRACLDKLGGGAAPEETARLRRDLNDIFVVVQVFTYPGDYVKECPTLERAAEVLLKLEEDALGNQHAAPRGPRRAVARLGPAIDVGEHLKAAGKLKAAVPSVTAELEKKIQGLLDDLGPGRPLTS